MLFAKGCLFLLIKNELSKSIKLIINYFFGLSLFAVLSYNLYHQIIQQPDLSLKWHQIIQCWQSPIFFLIIFLMLVNWGIESYKWKLLMHPLEELSFIKSVQSVLAGCSITMLTPNRTGEFGGRIMFVSQKNRTKAISLTFLGSISQLLVTLIGGSIAVIWINFFAQGESNFLKLAPYIKTGFLFIFILLSLLLFLLFINIRSFINWFFRFSFFIKIKKHLDILRSFENKVLLRILFYSCLRYLVFILQYVLILKLFQVDIEFHKALILLAVFYLLMAIIPTIGIVELPIRASASVILLGMFSTNKLGIELAAFGIWVLNLIIPSIIGSLFILNNKIITENDIT
jgi:hypothetical protein